MNDYVANANLRIIKKNHWIMLTNKVSNEYFDLEKSPVDVEKGGCLDRSSCMGLNLASKQCGLKGGRRTVNTVQIK